MPQKRALAAEDHANYSYFPRRSSERCKYHRNPVALGQVRPRIFQLEAAGVDIGTRYYNRTGSTLEVQHFPGSMAEIRMCIVVAALDSFGIDLGIDMGLDTFGNTVVGTVGGVPGSAVGLVVHGSVGYIVDHKAAGIADMVAGIADHRADHKVEYIAVGPPAVVAAAEYSLRRIFQLAAPAP